jgi:small subunit ribosomal protein S8e
MAITQSRSKRKVTSGKYQKYRKKRVHELGSLPTHTKLAERKSKIVRGVGGNKKARLLSTTIANVYDPKTKKYKKAKIKTILENPANRHFVRRNIITKGTIIDTEAGKAKITSRPGQDGTVNAVLI